MTEHGYVHTGGRQAARPVSLDDLRRRPDETVEQARARRRALMTEPADDHPMTAREVADCITAACPVPDSIEEDTTDDAA